jgi:hypothetical protein
MSTETIGKIQFAGKEALMKELQRTVAFLAYNSVLKSGSTKSGKLLHETVHTLYFGDVKNSDSIGYAEQMLQGMGAFGPMFERVEGTLRMKHMFHLMEEDIIVSDVPKEKGINMAVLSSKRLSNRVKLTPRTIWDFGKLVEKNGKKALALLSQSDYSDCIKTGIMPSGKNFDDYLNTLRELMYKELGVNTIDLEDDEETKTAGPSSGDVEQMKDSWMFPGFLAFALWGPILPDDMDNMYQAEAFMMSDNTNNKQNRKETKSIEQSSSRSIGTNKTQSEENTDYLMYASAVQTFSTNMMVAKNKQIDREINRLKEKIVRAERDRDFWKSFLTADMVLNTQNEIYMKFDEETRVLHGVEQELDTFISKVNERDETVPYECMVMDALLKCKPDDLTMETPVLRKKQRSETPMSSIDILMDTSADDFSFEQGK